MRHEDQLDQLIHEAGAHYHLPPDPPLHAMWEQIEVRVWPAASPSWSQARGPRWLALAAMLLLGVALGFGAARFTLGDRGQTALIHPRSAPGVPTALVTFPSPFIGLAADYLQHTTALLITVASRLREGPLSPEVTDQARHLLSTTRLILDAGVADPALHDLLEDLELLLAQVARLPQDRQVPDAALITEALDQRAVLPRLSLLLAEASYVP